MAFIVYIPELHKFLSDDQKSLTADFYEAARFTKDRLAADIAVREGYDTAHVLADMEQAG